MSIKVNISSVLKYGLAKLSMYTDDKPSDGLKFVANKNTEPNNYIQLHLLDAEKYGATAVYFKYFDNNRPPIPQIYIYEDTNLHKDINTLHKELWSSCKVPIFFIFSSTEIKIFNSLSKDMKQKDNIQPIEIIKLTSSIHSAFKARMFDTGDFWNTAFAKNFSYKKSAYESLLESLKLARDYLIRKEILPENTINSLLIKSILIRYLEERGVFEKKYWKTFSNNATSFIQVCEDSSDDNTSIINLFEDLSTHFNGGVFKFSNDEQRQIKNANLHQFTLFLRGDVNIKTLQLHFWNLYSFKDLPVELISNIYELFLKDQKGVVYTPSILVNLMIDEMMPLDNPKSDFKIIDPSCGSGIFLVGAYKRLVQWWMIKNNLKKPDVDVLKSIVENNIYGIDEKKEAVELAKFSLSLALCDVLSPEAIWNELHFNDLSKTGNLITSDFFLVLNDEDTFIKYKNKFDLVIGNPPFISKLTTKDTKEIEVHSAITNVNRPKLPDNQLALLFLEQSFKLCKKNQYVCMVQPSAFLYTNNVESFRKYLFNSFNARQIIDFAGLNTTLFKRTGSGADVAVSVAFFQNQKPNIDNSELLHLTVRQTFESREKIYFDLSYYDFHWIDYKVAITNKYIWKCNLVGGHRVVDIVNRLRQYPTLKEYLYTKTKNDNWLYSEGYILGNKKKDSHYLYNHLALLPKSTPLTNAGIDWDKTYYIPETSFEAPRNKELFEAPLVIIREVFDKKTILLDYSDKDIAFTNRYIGISAPHKYKNDLKKIVKNIKKHSKEYIFYIIATSSQAGIGMATALLKKDIDMLPYPLTENKEFSLSKIEQYFANDTIDYMFDWISGKRNVPLLNNVHDKQLEEYKHIYCDILNTVYKHYKPLNILKTQQFIIILFYYKNKPNIHLNQVDSLDSDLENLINEKAGENINIKRVFKLYDKNVIYIIKPKQYRFWLKSIAVRDADDTFSDLIKMRY